MLAVICPFKLSSTCSTVIVKLTKIVWFGPKSSIVEGENTVVKSLFRVIFSKLLFVGFFIKIENW